MRISDWTSDVCSSDLKPFAGDVRNAGRGGAKAPRGQPAVVRQCRHCGAGRHRRPLTASGTEGSLSAITSKGGQSSGVGLRGGAEARRVYVQRQPGLSLLFASEHFLFSRMCLAVLVSPTPSKAECGTKKGTKRTQ